MSKERIGSLLFLIVGILALVQSVQFPMGTLEKPGPGVFPLILSVLLAAIGVLLLFAERGQGRLNWSRLLREKGTVWKIIILSAAFISAFEGLGYLAGSAGYLFLLFFWVCRFRAGAAVALTAIIAISSWYFFGTILGLQLPVGPRVL
ncbi:MAG: tripartite tricarboxylate transporter TctB family protein [Thermodesulfobacteriota bacterium]|jgi:hypothetical protein